MAKWLTAAAKSEGITRSEFARRIFQKIMRRWQRAKAAVKKPPAT
jgi:hypothetical protein